MKILLIADKTSPELYECYNAEKLRDIDLVISCGDLPLYYMEFIVSMLNIPCCYVAGNHDKAFVRTPPPGWQTLDDRLIDHKGIVLMGLGGSMRYKPGPHQYTEGEMSFRYMKMRPKLWLKKNRLDILVAHAPAYGLGDLESRPHKGFKVFRAIMERHEPKYFLHGHVHLNYSRYPRQMTHGNTKIINGYQHHIFDF